MPFNPWSQPKVAAHETPYTPIAARPDYPPMETAAYAAPPLSEGSPYNDEFGWSNPDLRPSTVGYPSAQRLQTFPRKDFVADADRPPEEFYEQDRGLETLARHQVEYQDADGFATLGHQLKRAPDPRWTATAEPRPTQRLSPSSYRFIRPFPFQDSARSLNGNHFSMADHRRNYEIYGMAPVRTMRNTYRLEPAPWDSAIVDVPPPQHVVQAQTTGQEIPSGPRSWRL